MAIETPGLSSNWLPGNSPMPNGSGFAPTSPELTTSPLSSNVPPAGTPTTRSASGGLNSGASGEALRLIPEPVARRYLAIPLRKEGDRLVVAMADVGDVRTVQDLEARALLEVVPVLADASDILSAIDLYYSSIVPKEVLEALDGSYDDPIDSGESLPGSTSESDSRDVAALADEGAAPVIRVVDSLIAQAIRARATDIHVDPSEDHLSVRFRVDGFLQQVASFPVGSLRAILSRIKVMAGMDIAETRRPQDGHTSVRVGDSEVDIRIATADTAYGESAVLRLLDRSIGIMTPESLGLLPGPLETFHNLLSANYGMIVVAGPTGAGKTTTLYASLNEVDRTEKQIITIEDPVEYRLPGVNSIQINEKAGITFPSILRAVLRMDPDTIMVGEIRDAETARIAVQAALTGHQVLTSLHANDAHQALLRLVDLGVEPFLLASALNGVVAQRMIRKTCRYCLVPGPSPQGLDPAGLNASPEEETNETAVGCYLCSFTGYRGRTGIFEVVKNTEDIMTALLRGAAREELAEISRRQCDWTMKDDGMFKASQGITTRSEVLRCIHMG